MTLPWSGSYERREATAPPRAWTSKVAEEKPTVSWRARASERRAGLA